MAIVQNVGTVTLLIIAAFSQVAQCDDVSEYDNLIVVPQEEQSQNNNESTTTVVSDQNGSEFDSESKLANGSIGANPIGVLNTPPYRVFGNIFPKPTYIDWMVDQKLKFLAQQNYLNAEDVYQLYAHLYIVKSDLTTDDIYETVKLIVNAIYRYREKNGLLPIRAPFDIGRRTEDDSRLESPNISDMSALTFPNTHSLSARRDYSSSVLSYIVDEFIEEYTNVYQMLNYIFPQIPRSLHEDIKRILYHLCLPYGSDVYGTLLVRIDSNVRFLMTDLIKYVPQTPFLY